MKQELVRRDSQQQCLTNPNNRFKGPIKSLLILGVLVKDKIRCFQRASSELLLHNVDTATENLKTQRFVYDI